MYAMKLRGLLERGRVLAASLALGTAILFTPAYPAAAQIAVQDGLVNVAVGDVNILNDVNIAVAADVAAIICGVDVGPVAVLGQAVDASGDKQTVCTKNGAPITISQN